MHFKATLVLALFAAAQIALAQPPACLLAALNTQPNPADLTTVCGSQSSSVQKSIQNVCPGSDTSAALSSFAGTCKDAGITVKSVAASPSTSSSSASGNTKIPSFSVVLSATSPRGATDTAKPSTVTYSSAYLTSSCSCTLTSSFIGTSKASGTSSTRASATGFTEGGNTGSSGGSSSASAAGASSTVKTTSGAGQVSTASFAGVVIAVAGVIYAL